MIIRVDNAGRILLPAQTRKFLGIEKGKLIKMELVDNKVIITRVEEEEDVWTKKEQLQ